MSVTNFDVVPWKNSAEWYEVYNKILMRVNLEEALDKLLIWKARCPLLPPGIDCTITLLNVYLKDLNNKDDIDITTNYVLRLAYSSAIRQYVNYTLGANKAKTSRSKNKLEVPNWIIDLKHETVSSKLPSVDLLREAANISLKCLQKNYWDNQCIQDCIISKWDLNMNDSNRVTTIMDFCLSLCICRHSKFKVLSDISDKPLREYIIKDIRYLFGDKIDLSDLKRVSIMSLVNVMNKQCKKDLLHCKNKGLIVKTLLGTNSPFLSTEFYYHLCYNKLTHRRRLSIVYVKCFELLLVFLHSNDLIFEFVLGLVHMTQDSDDNEKCLLAALWLSEILQALKRSKDFRKKINGMYKKTDMPFKIRKDLISLYNNWFGNTYKDVLVLDLLKTVPSELTKIKFLSDIISSYNPYLTYFIRDLLNLIKPKIPEVAKDKLCKLASNISSPEKKYTLEDVERVYPAEANRSMGIQVGIKDFEGTEVEPFVNIVQQGPHWQPVYSCDMLSKYPIGYEIKLRKSLKVYAKPTKLIYDEEDDLIHEIFSDSDSDEDKDAYLFNSYNSDEDAWV